ncbi:MAG: hypothetical protein RIE56_13905 [Amphiplicatus sp.]
MQQNDALSASGRGLIRLGAVLFLFGLLTGLAVPAMQLPRMALASHLEGLFNGLLLMVVGLFWERLALGPRHRAVAFGAIVYAAFANWFATLLSAATGAAAMMPLAGGGSTGAKPVEFIVAALLLSLSLAMIAGVGLLIYGLRKAPAA